MEKILNTSSSIKKDKVVIVTEVEREYGESDLRMEIDNIKRQKQRVLGDNARLIEEHARLTTQQAEFEGHLLALIQGEEEEVVETEVEPIE